MAGSALIYYFEITFVHRQAHEVFDLAHLPNGFLFIFCPQEICAWYISEVHLHVVVYRHHLDTIMTSLVNSHIVDLIERPID